MRRLSLALLLVAGCTTAAPLPDDIAGDNVAGALANVALATGVGAARVHAGECFTICAPGTVCNPKTKLCDVIPCRGLCASDEVCDTSGPLDHCIKAPALQVSERHDSNADEKLPVGITPPLSSAPPTSPQHPDVPAASP